jgi:hypothetical protein
LEEFADFNGETGLSDSEAVVDGLAGAWSNGHFGAGPTAKAKPNPAESITKYP